MSLWLKSLSVVTGFLSFHGFLGRRGNVSNLVVRLIAIASYIVFEQVAHPGRHSGSRVQEKIYDRVYRGTAWAGTASPIAGWRIVRARIPRQYFSGTSPIAIMKSWLPTKASNGPKA